MALTDKLTAIADAIRGKTGKIDSLTLDQMPTEIAGIETGGGGDMVSLIERTIAEIDDNAVTIVGGRAFDSCKELTSARFTNATEVAGYAFNNCTGLVTVDLPVVIKTAQQAFTGCTSLKNVNMPLLSNDSGGYCFRNCTALQTITLPALTALGNGEFENCSALAYVDLPVATSVGRSAFGNCTALQILVLRNAEQCATMSNVNSFTGTPFASGGAGGTVYVPSALIAEYQQATNWSTLYTAGTCNFVAIEGSEYE